MTETPPTRVLVVVFDSLQRDLIVLSLRRNAYQVTVCEDLTRLRTLLQEILPQVLLIDLYLPKVNGLDLIKFLGREGLLAQTVVMAVSSFGFPEVVQQAIQAGVADFLIKPVNPDFLLERLEITLSKARKG